MPEIGRFITADPIMGTGSLNLREPISLNLYSYCKDNPLRFIDPDGEVAWRVAGIGALDLAKGCGGMVGGGILVTSGVATTPVGGIGVLKIGLGMTAMSWGALRFGQGIVNVTLGLTNHQAMPDVMETIAKEAVGKKGVVAVKVGSLVLDIVTPDGSEIVNERQLKLLIKAINKGSTIQELNELAEELGIEITPRFEDSPNKESMKQPRTPLEELRKEMGLEERHD